MEVWMNKNPFYKKVPKDYVPEDYFRNSAKR